MYISVCVCLDPLRVYLNNETHKIILSNSILNVLIHSTHSLHNIQKYIKKKKKKLRKN